jgi:hypothetical protein
VPFLEGGRQEGLFGTLLSDRVKKMRVYTLGRTTSYDKTLAGPEGCMKVGSRPVGDDEFPEGYGGGWVWFTAEDADAFRQSPDWVKAFPTYDPSTFSVYAIEVADESWVSLVPHPSDGVHRLLVDAHVVNKVNVEEQGRIDRLLDSADAVCAAYDSGVTSPALMAEARVCLKRLADIVRTLPLR